MKAKAKLQTAGDGLEQQQNLKLTQFTGKLSATILKVKNALEITDEYFFGYMNFEQKKPDYEDANLDKVDLEVRFGIL